ncbi:hypothetical protein BD410DRAFT_809997 [Rickenella mellea]|uniref:Uncharacterized protein n=1 Tax=Rickenella mellea TaxID=50990 RepID=A0A4Y7PHR7_9AGAM|nr:hypothetical protein BD410DRAFT_809997 [Rickenella mellea]
MASPHISESYLRKLLVFAVASLPAMQFAWKEFDPANMTDETVKASFTALPHLLDHLIEAEEQISNAEENGKEVEANVSISTQDMNQFLSNFFYGIVTTIRDRTNYITIFGLLKNI